MPVVSAGATWVIGKVFIQHFASGGTLLDFNPPDYREFIKTQREKLGIRSGAVRPAAPSAAPLPQRIRAVIYLIGFHHSGRDAKRVALIEPSRSIE